MKKATLPFTAQVLKLLFLSSLVSVFLWLVRAATAGDLWLAFMLWNLLLAWLPLLFALGLRINLRKKPWRHWQNMLLTFLWLGFLPNSFYMISDYIHLQSSGEVSVLYDIAMLTSFVLNGLVLGYISLYLVHLQISKRLDGVRSNALVGVVLLSCGFAIYLGRYLRWNTWDIIFNPAGILFDISERLINPVVHLQTYTITFVYFLVIASIYAVIYELLGILRQDSKN